MNHLLLRSSSYLWRRGQRLLISTNASTSSFSSTAQSDSLQHRITAARGSSVSMASLIKQWLQEGRKVRKNELRSFIDQLHKYRRYEHALQISEWMTGEGGYTFSATNVAIQLDLIGKVHGLAKAEEYFNSISESSRGYQVYAALLNCYAKTKQLEKAEAIMQNLMDMGCVNVSPYNVMLGLYSRMGRYEKIDILEQEMEKRGIIWDTYTYNIRLQAYVACSDFDGMEKLLTNMEANSCIKTDSYSYSTAGHGYLKSGRTDKSLELFRKAEQLIPSKSRKLGYETLLTAYAATGSKDDVYRVWDLYKQMGRFSNEGYISMITALVKMDDLDSAENVFEEWDSGMDKFDIRVPNLMIDAYSKKGDLVKAEGYLKKITEKGEEPNATSWDHLAGGYLLSGQLMKAVDTIKKSVSTRKQGRLPNLKTLETCLKSLKGQGDKEAAEELWKMVKEQCYVSTFAYNILSRCINGENLESNVFDPIEDDDESPAKAALPGNETV